MHKKMLTLIIICTAHIFTMEQSQTSSTLEIEVELISSDNQKFNVSRTVAQHSGTLKSILNMPNCPEAEAASFSFREIDSTTLTNVVHIMTAAHKHHQLKGKAFLDILSKEVSLPDEQIIPVLYASNFLECMADVKLVGQHVGTNWRLRQKIAPLIESNQLSDTTIREVARIYYLITRGDLKGLDRNRPTFSMRDYLEHMPDQTQFQQIIDLRKWRLGDLEGFQTIPGLHNLYSLELSGNQLTELHTTHIQGLSSLSTLNITDNQLTQLPANLFQNLNALGQLCLSGNQLTQLPAQLFHGLTNLKYLYLLNNQLAELSANQFQDLTKLETLNLTGNRLTQLPETLLQGLSKLSDLQLSKNALKQLPENLFHGIYYLYELNLTSNQLKELPTNFIPRYVGRLYLENNQFTDAYKKQLWEKYGGSRILQL